MSDFTGETKDGTQGNIEELMRLFPQVVTEAKDGNGRLVRSVDFAALRELLGDDTSENDERYDFTWAGKKEAMREAARPTRKTLRPCKEESKNWDTTRNLYIEGDNLEALKILENTYHGQVKMIYIDPPYNTGHDFIYHDSFGRSQKDEDLLAGIVSEETGEQFAINPETNGRYHSDWCSMMYPRLVLARKLLRDDGVLFMSIDDNEVVNARKLCDEVFGECGFVNIVSVLAKNTAGASGGGEDRRLKKNVEYLLIYAKQYQELVPFEGVYEYTELSDLIAKYRAEGISWKYNSVLVNPGRKEYMGSTVDGEGNEIKVFRRVEIEIKSISSLANEEGISEKDAYRKYGCFVFDTTNAQTSIRDRVIEYRRVNSVDDDVLSIEYVPRSGKHKGQIYEQFYKGDKCRLFVWLRDTSEEIDGVLYKRDVLGTLWDISGEMKNLTKEGGVAFANGKKPVLLLKNALKMQTSADDLVIDFFSGSATTAHAVMQLNAEDGGNRRFIMVQLPEVCAEDSEAAKAGYKNICEIGKERIRRAGEKISEELRVKNEEREKNKDLFDSSKSGQESASPLDVGFRVFKVSDSNMEDVFYSPNEVTQTMLPGMVNNVKEGRTGLDLLISTRLEWGLSIDCPIDEEMVDGKTVFSVDGGQMLACFETGITDAFVKKLAMRKPQFAIFRDVDFKDSAAKINAREIFKAVCGKDAPTEVRFL